MYIKLKCCFLKKDIDPVVLGKYGFFTLNDGLSYWRNIGEFNFITFYHDSRRFTFRYPKKNWYKTVRKYIRDLIEAELIEIKPMWEYWSFGEVSWQRQEKIEAKLERLNDE